jgi:hypothetical protein
MECIVKEEEANWKRVAVLLKNGLKKKVPEANSKTLLLPLKTFLNLSLHFHDLAQPQNNPPRKY